jgi:mandelate racemase
MIAWMPATSTKSAVKNVKAVTGLTVRALSARAVAVPMRRPLQTSTGAVSVAPLIMVDLRTSAGITGRSYLFAIGRAHLKPLVAVLEAMGEMIAGDPVAPFELERKLRARYTLLGVHNVVLFGMAAIDMCAWDALGQALGQPVARLLGGEPGPVPAYNSKGLGIMPLKALAKEAGELVEEGFSAVKLRLGRPRAEDDLQALRAVKRVIGTGITLMTDFNQALSVA